MPKIQSKIGNTSTTFTPVRNYMVDDPSLQKEQEEFNNNQMEEENILPPKNKMVRITPEQYNNMRSYLKQTYHAKQDENEDDDTHFSSTQSIIEDEDLIDAQPVSQESINMINTFMKPEDTSNVRTSNQNFGGPELKKLNTNKKNKIEVLLGLKKQLAYKEIDGHTIGLRNVRSAQTSRVLQEVSKSKTNLEQVYILKHMMLAFALDSIDGESIHSILDNQDTEEMRLEIISNMEPSVVDALYDMYIKDISDKINAKTPKETEQLGDDLKK